MQFFTVYHAARTRRAIPTYALYVAMKDRMQLWVQSSVCGVSRVLNPDVWGKYVPPCVLDALYDCEGSGRRCSALEDCRRFLRPDVVYNALSRVLEYSVLPLDGRRPRIACFKVLRSSVQRYRSAMPVYVQDWLIMALRSVQYALAELFPAGRP